AGFTGGGLRGAVALDRKKLAAASSPAGALSLDSTLSRRVSIYPPCRCLPWRPGSSRGASPPKPISCPPAANGCTRSSTTASASLAARMMSACGSTAVPARTSPAASRYSLMRSPPNIRYLDLFVEPVHYLALHLSFSFFHDATFGVTG